MAANQEVTARKNNSPRWLSKSIIAVLILLATYFLLSPETFNPITGEYTYDPRVTVPSSLLVTRRPEMVLTDYLTTESNVLSFEVVRVVIYTYTDWQPMARVSVILHNKNGSSGMRDYRFNSGSASSAELGVFAFSYHVYYSRLDGCQEALDGGFDCHLAPTS